MFILHALCVSALVYLVAAVVSEVVLTSPEERSLSPIVRTGFGLVIALVFFSAAWLLMPALHAAGYGLGLLVLCAYVNRTFLVDGGAREAMQRSVVSHLRALPVVLGIGVVFFAPLFIAWNFGPFTEGGGDISIYADTAKYLYDGGLTEYGFTFGGPSHYWSNLKDAIGIDMYDRHAAIDYDLLNPPRAESAAYRILLARVMCPFFYAPYALFGFAAGDTNYPVFYGFLALVYAIVVGAVWHFTRPFGRGIALVSTALVMASHGIASIFYNVYAAQSLSLAISALILAALPSVRPLSWAGFRTYGSVLIYTLGCYTHYLAVIAPMVFAGLFLRRQVAGGRTERRSRLRRAALAMIAVVYVFALLLMVIGSKESVALLLSVAGGKFGQQHNPYMGDAAPVFSLRWNDFTLGVLSQQHFKPFMGEVRWVMITAAAAALAGFTALAVGAATMARVVREAGWRHRECINYALIYAAAALVCVVNLAAVGASLYTQAKGAQNILVYVYAAMFIPLALAWRHLYPMPRGRLWFVAAAATIVAFLASMAIIRGEQAVRLGFGVDRSGVTEPSFFAEARRIREADPQGFVLVEPRNSADLYTTVQPFFRARSVPVRHLVLQTISFPTQPASEATRVTTVVMVPDLIEPADVSHLWYLASVREPRAWSITGYGFTWKAQRLADSRAPMLLLSAHDFERDFGKRAVASGAAQQALFSYVRNGAGMVYVPPGVSGGVTARLEARNPADRPAMVKELEDAIASGRLPAGSRLHDDGNVVTLALSLEPAVTARLLTVARYTGEFWLNVELPENRESR